jgi:hypothetical protein
LPVPVPVEQEDFRFRVFSDHAVRYALDPSIRALAEEICGIGKTAPPGDRSLADSDPDDLRLCMARKLLSFVQSAHFTGPLPGFTNPLDTLAMGEGDCKSLSTLLAALALSVGCHASFMSMGENGEASHVCALLRPYPSSPWLWAETTLDGAELGEHPSYALARLAPDVSRPDLANAKQLGAIGCCLALQANEKGERSFASIGAMSTEQHQAARAVIVQAFQQELGRAPSTFEAQMVQAICLLESSYGTGWKSPCDTSHNWGAVQATSSSQTQCEYSDSYPDGTRYTQGFRTYPDDVSGAQDVVHFLYVNMPAVGKALQSAAGTDGVARAMFFSHYFGGFCPNALATYGDAAKQSMAFGAGPATTPAGKACENEAIQSYADTLYKNGSDIAAALGEAPPPRTSGSIVPWLLFFGVVGGAGYLAYRKLRRPRARHNPLPFDQYQPEEDRLL